MRFTTKIAVVLREDLPTWQKLNMTAFLASGIAATVEDVTGEPYEDASGTIYLPMFRQPVLVFFTEELFSTGGDEENRAAVRVVPSEQLNLVGLALRDDKKVVDNVIKGLSLHQ